MTQWEVFLGELKMLFYLTIVLPIISMPKIISGYSSMIWEFLTQLFWVKKQNENHAFEISLYSCYASHTIEHENKTIAEYINPIGGSKNGIINGFSNTNILIYSSNINRKYSIGNGDSSSNTRATSTGFSTVDAIAGESVSTFLNLLRQRLCHTDWLGIKK